MMFRSLFFVAPLVSADEQTAMLQLNRRGEVHQHTANDMMVGSLEQSLMAKEPEKMSETAVCTYYLKTVHATTLLQKMSELKGEEKTQQLLQRAMDSVGTENLRSLEDNLMSKEDDKKEEVKDSEKKLTPCEVLTELRHAFKHHMQHFREIEQKTKDTGRKLGDLIADKLKESAKAAAKVMEGAAGKSGTDLQAVVDEATKTFAKISIDVAQVEKFEEEEAKKAVEAIDNVIPKLKGSQMANTLKTAKTSLHDAVKKYETTALTTIGANLAKLETGGFEVPKKVKDGKDVWPAGFTKTEADDAIKAVRDAFVKSEDERNKALDSAVDKILKPYVAHVFKEDTDKIWIAFRDFWKASNVLNTPASFVMEKPPKCNGEKGCLDIGDDLFWQQASGYLEGKTVCKDDKDCIEATCLSGAFKDQGHDFVPRKVCDGDHKSLECADEFLYMAKKAKKVAKDVCTNTVEKTDIPNDTKLSDKKFTDITELSFMNDNGATTTHACEKWEEIKDACKSIKA